MSVAVVIAVLVVTASYAGDNDGDGGNDGGGIGDGGSGDGGGGGSGDDSKKMSLSNFGNMYQRKAAKLIQDFTACANDVAQETLSSIRIVRAYGTGKKEFGRCFILFLLVQAIATELSIYKRSRECGFWVLEPDL